jgi:hypothetical protein
MLKRYNIARIPAETNPELNEYDKNENTIIFFAFDNGYANYGYFYGRGNAPDRPEIGPAGCLHWNPAEGDGGRVYDQNGV